VTLVPASFVRKHNRFVGTVLLDGKETTVLIPNTGRLAELLLPGRQVLLAPYQGKHPYKLLYVIYRGNPVFIDSVGSNAVFGRLLAEKKVPGLEEYRLLRREVPFGRHRFDFLLESPRGKEIFCELKSCTLAWNGVAAFPDAPTERGRDHILTLRKSGRGMVVFFILHRDVTIFVPDYHTHYEFYETVKECAGDVEMRACAAIYNENHDITGLSPVRMLLPEVPPTGSYLLVYHNPGAFCAAVGALGQREFPPGYYVYAGSGMANLYARIGHHRKKGGKKHWHIDYVKGPMRLVSDLPMAGIGNRECELAEDLAALGGKAVPGFGSSDCRCGSHFYFFQHDPRKRESFWDMVLERRFGGIGRTNG